MRRRSMGTCRAFGVVTGVAWLIVAGPSRVVGQDDDAVEIVEFGGWARNARISNGEAELIVTLEVGPRIISYRRLDGENVFKVYEPQLGGSGEEGWMIRGGHRLWVSPEDPSRTYVPDNGPVHFEQTGPRSVRVSLPPDPVHRVRKEMQISLDAQGTGTTIEHRLRNDGQEPTELAIWALTVMRPGGVEVIPLPPKAPHPGGAEDATAEQYAPQFGLALWSYADFTDPRYHFGSRAIILRQDPTASGPTKIGISSTLGTAGYLNGGTLFVKRFSPFEMDRRYPDLGSNYETFTNGEMLEMESLGPLVRLAPGETVTHVERWELIEGVEAGEGPEEVVEAVLPRLERVP